MLIYLSFIKKTQSGNTSSPRETFLQDFSVGFFARFLAHVLSSGLDYDKSIFAENWFFYVDLSIDFIIIYVWCGVAVLFGAFSGGMVCSVLYACVF